MQITSKNDKTEDLLRISYLNFKNYNEFLLSDEIKWGNTHLDHVCSLSSFDLKDSEQLKQATHFSKI